MEDEAYEGFDAHPHVVDDRFPLIPNMGYLLSRFTVTDTEHGQCTRMPLLSTTRTSGNTKPKDKLRPADQFAEVHEHGAIAAHNIPAATAYE